MSDTTHDLDRTTLYVTRDRSLCDCRIPERCDWCRPESVPYVEVDRETVVDHATRLSFSVRVF